MSFFGSNKSNPSPASSQKTHPPSQSSSSKPPSRANSIQVNDHQFLLPDLNIVSTSVPTRVPATSSHGYGTSPSPSHHNSQQVGNSYHQQQGTGGYHYNHQNDTYQLGGGSGGGGGGSVGYGLSGLNTINIPLTTTSSNFFERDRDNSMSSTNSNSFNPHLNHRLPTPDHFTHNNSNNNNNNSQYIPANNQGPQVVSVPVADNELQIDESLFDDLEYNPQYDVYWDALEAPEDAYLNIAPPNSVEDPNSPIKLRRRPPQLFPPPPPQESIQLPHQQRLSLDTMGFNNNLNATYPQQRNYNLTSTSLDSRPASYRKHKRDESNVHENVDGSEYVDNGGDDEESEEGIKAMRYGSLGRIIASTVAASSINERKLSMTERAPEQQEEYRKELVQKFMKNLNQSNMNGLAKIIREKFHEACLLITPEVFEPISGRADVMIMFSLLLETYPDSVWTTLSTNVTQLDTITCLYLFKGTKLFSYPLSSLFRQIKAHIAKLPQTSANEEISSTRLVNEVADYIHVNPSTPTSLSGHHPLDLSLAVQRPGSMRQSFGMDDGVSGRWSESNDYGGHHAESINIPRRDQTLREVKSIETAVLKEGSTTYRRKIDFVFNEIDQIIRVVVINVIS